MKKYIIIGGVVLIVKILKWVMPYLESASLCETIEKGETELAIEKIENMKDINCGPYPEIVKSILNAVEYNIDLPLIVACKKGNYLVVEELLKKGADPNKYYTGGFTAAEAVFAGNTYCELEILKLLISYGADVTKSASGTSPLFCAARKMLYTNGERREYFTSCVKYLFMHDENLLDEKGYSLLYYAVWSDNVLLMKYLMENEKHLIDLTASNGQTVLFEAVKKNSLEMVKVLIEKGADKSVVDSKGRTAYDYAVESGNVELQELLK